MFKKKTTQQREPYEAELIRLSNELTKIGVAMDAKIKKAYVAGQAVSLYIVDSPDWRRACADRDRAQESLLCLIAQYDDKYAQYIRYKEKHPGINFIDPYTSHEYIESELARILTKH